MLITAVVATASPAVWHAPPLPAQDESAQPSDQPQATADSAGQGAVPFGLISAESLHGGRSAARRINMPSKMGSQPSWTIHAERWVTGEWSATRLAILLHLPGSDGNGVEPWVRTSGTGRPWRRGRERCDRRRDDHAAQQLRRSLTGSACRGCGVAVIDSAVRDQIRTGPLSMLRSRLRRLSRCTNTRCSHRSDPS